MSTLEALLLVSSVLSLFFIVLIMRILMKILHQMTVGELNIMTLFKKTDDLDTELTDFEKTTDLRYENMTALIRNIEKELSDYKMLRYNWEKKI